MTNLKRRDFLKTSAAFAAASAAGGFSCVEIASAQPIQVPTIDKLTMRVLIDQSHDQFLRGSTVKGVMHEGPGPGRSADIKNVFHNQWGLSLFLQSQRAAEQRTILLDFGYTAEALINNIGSHARRSGQDPGADRQPRPLRPFRRPARLSRQVSQRAAGRSQALCRRRGQFLPPLRPNARRGPVHRFRHARPPRARRQASDGRAVRNADRGRRTMPSPPARSSAPASNACCQTASSSSRSRTGSAAMRATTLPAELQGKIVPDEHIHEHATCFNIKDRGLVVISSCGHVGIVNSVRQAQEVSGVQKVHAIVGGFHLGPAPADYLKQVVAEIRKLQAGCGRSRCIAAASISSGGRARRCRTKRDHHVDRQPPASSAREAPSGAGR